MSEFKLLIDGKLVPGENQTGGINPANGSVFAQCPMASPVKMITGTSLPFDWHELFVCWYAGRKTPQ